MLKVGITGGIGCGKSIVSSIFKAIGIPVFDADQAAKKIMQEDAVVKQQLISTFGTEVFEHNQLNKKYLANLVFNDSFLLEKLNAIVHPATIQAGLNWAAKQNSPYVLREAALLFEAGSTVDLDVVIGVFAPLVVRIQRVMQRDNVSKQEVLNRMSKQIDDTIKMKLCDYVIINDGREALIPQVLKLHHIFLAKAKAQLV
jgi:dephospho-CoA kinase